MPAGSKSTTLFVQLAAPRILRAGEHVDLLGMPATPQDQDLWSKFNIERDEVTVRVCYCSVFNECWRGSGTTTQADPVASCPKAEVPYLAPGQSNH
jgi:hypothetical protein